eukprot:SAG11_NODE_10172_length_850_cov_0.673768_1_plen_45_part_10
MLSTRRVCRVLTPAPPPPPPHALFRRPPQLIITEVGEVAPDQYLE